MTDDIRQRLSILGVHSREKHFRKLFTGKLNTHGFMKQRHHWSSEQLLGKVSATS